MAHIPVVRFYKNKNPIIGLGDIVELQPRILILCLISFISFHDLLSLKAYLYRRDGSDLILAPLPYPTQNLVE